MDKPPAVYYLNCHSMITIVSKHTKLLIQLINMDTDGSSSDLNERLDKGYKDICITFQKITESMPNRLVSYYHEKNIDSSYENPVRVMEEMIKMIKMIKMTQLNIRSEEQINLNEILLNTMEIGYSAIEACTDVTNTFNVKNNLSLYEHTISTLLIFMIDISLYFELFEPENKNKIIEDFYENYRNFRDLSNMITHLSYKYYNDKYIQMAENHNMHLYNNWNKIYESMPMTEDEKTKFVNKINSQRPTDIIMEMTHMLDILVCFINNM